MSERTRDVLRLIGGLLVLAGVYVGVAAVVSWQLPAKAEVRGIHVGGMSIETAKDRLAKKLTPLEREPVTIRAGKQTRTLVPGDVGLHLDLDGTLAGATGFSLDPREIWHRLAGGGPYPLQVTVESGALEEVVRGLAPAVDRPVREGTIEFEGTHVSVLRSAEGRTLDVGATTTAIEKGWPDRTAFDAVVIPSPPTVPPAEIDRLAAEVAQPAVSAPLVLVAGAERVTVPAARFAPALRMTPVGAGMRLSLDEKLFGQVVADALPDVVHAPVDAGLVITDGRPTVTPARPGSQVRTDLTAENATSVLGRRPPARVAAVALRTTTPRLTTAQVRSWGISRPVASVDVADMPEPAADNARRALDALDGALIAPGARFSLDDRLGPRTATAGYVEASTGGDPEVAIGGGIDQVASALYEAAFRAGAGATRTPPPVHLASTADGLDATLVGGDVVITSPSGGAVFVQAESRGRAGRVTLWAARPADVSVQVGARAEVQPPGPPRQEAAPGCVSDPGEEGFRVTVTRVLPGGADRGESSDVAYRPRPGVECLSPGEG